MPELPEVETIRRGLHDLIVGKVVANAECLQSPKSFPNAPADVSTFLIGATVASVQRRAKVLLMELSSGYTLVTHLKMTGQLVYESTGEVRDKSYEIRKKQPVLPTTNKQLRHNELHPEFGDITNTRVHSDTIDPHISYLLSHNSNSAERWGGGHPSDSFVHELPDNTTRVVLTFSDDSTLFFNDLRKFGWMKLVPTAEVPYLPFMQKVGPEPLEAAFTGKILFVRLQRRKNTSIKAAILDQTVLAGVGNIYADESLWAAKIHPSTQVKYLSLKQIELLADEVKYVMKLSIEKGGSTDKNYVDAEGKKGSYLNFANVFRREGQPCPRCGTTIEKIRVAGRGTHICPRCQTVGSK